VQPSLPVVRRPWPVLEGRQRPLAVAHRGDSAGWRENTLDALAAAAASGVDAIEVDVRFTAGGVPVLLHDATLRRTTGLRARLDRIALHRLRRLESRRGASLAGPGGRVPTFAQALEALVPGVHVLAEVKVDRPAEHGAPGAARALLATARRFAPPGGVTFISFDPYTLRRLRTVDPGCELGILASRRLIPDPAALAEELGIALTLLPLRAARRSKVAKLQARGLAVLVYTADGAAVERALASGADGILANDPRALLRRLGREPSSGWRTAPDGPQRHDDTTT
jgi:glycerophosphoryl diester phosphodiesterase